MIIPVIKKLNRGNIFRYLGLQSHAPSLSPEYEDRTRLEQQIVRCEQMVLEASEVRCVYRILPVSSVGLDNPDPLHDADRDSFCTAGTDYHMPLSQISLNGNDIRRLLDGCSEVVLMALTLGGNLEKLLMRTEVTDMSDALVLDVCASAAVESAADDFEQKLAAELKPDGKYLTNRFSPGYGDLPLSHQRDLLDLLNAARAAGITLTPSGLMVPRKSMTAVIGICGSMKEKVLGGCVQCPLRTKCSWRVHGMRCYDS